MTILPQQAGGLASAVRSFLGATLFLGATGLQAQPACPQRPATIVVAFAPGGMTDIVTRAMAKALGETLKQTIIIENKAGAAGQFATE